VFIKNRLFTCNNILSDVSRVYTVCSLNIWLAVRSRKITHFLKEFQMYAVTDTSVIGHNRYLISVVEFVYDDFISSRKFKSTSLDLCQ